MSSAPSQAEDEDATGWSSLMTDLSLTASSTRPRSTSSSAASTSSSFSSVPASARSMASAMRKTVRLGAVVEPALLWATELTGVQAEDGGEDEDDKTKTNGGGSGGTPRRDTPLMKVRKFEAELAGLYNDDEGEARTEELLVDKLVGARCSPETKLWFRAKILDTTTIRDETHVKIFLADYGEFIEHLVPARDCIRSLPTHMSIVPCLAFQVVLSGLIPADDFAANMKYLSDVEAAAWSPAALQLVERIVDEAPNRLAELNDIRRDVQGRLHGQLFVYRPCRDPQAPRTLVGINKVLLDNKLALYRRNRLVESLTRRPEQACGPSGDGTAMSIPSEAGSVQDLGSEWWGPAYPQGQFCLPRHDAALRRRRRGAASADDDERSGFGDTAATGGGGAEGKDPAFPHLPLPNVAVGKWVSVPTTRNSKNKAVEEEEEARVLTQARDEGTCPWEAIRKMNKQRQAQPRKVQCIIIPDGIDKGVFLEEQLKNIDSESVGPKNIKGEEIHF